MKVCSVPLYDIDYSKVLHCYLYRYLKLVKNHDCLNFSHVTSKNVLLALIDLMVCSTLSLGIYFPGVHFPLNIQI